MGERKLAMSFRSLLLEEVHDRYRGALAFGDAAQAAKVKLPRDAPAGRPMDFYLPFRWGLVKRIFVFCVEFLIERVFRVKSVGRHSDR
jgi:hypothetical protein